IGGRQASRLDLMSDVGCAENAGGEPDEGVEHNEDDIEIVDQEIIIGHGRLHKQPKREEKRRQTGEHIEPRREPIAGDNRENRGRRRRNKEHRHERVEHRHGCSPRKRSSVCTSTLSKRSRMRNRKMPMTMNAIRMEKATLISTTKGIPLAPVAARMSPF